jgi:hypothetical protein
MIVSHRYKFIFIKNAKTAGTSIEVFLSRHCGEEDVLTPIAPPVESHQPRNFSGYWNPWREILEQRGLGAKKVIQQVLRRRKFYNHMPACLVRHRVPPRIWNSYFKFCVERNPWEKTLSHFEMVKSMAGGDLTLDDYFGRGKYCTNIDKYTDACGSLLVDEVIRYENLSAELQRVFNRLGVPFDGSLGVNAKSEYRKERRPYQEVLTAEQADRVRRIYAREIEMHGYAF